MSRWHPGRFSSANDGQFTTILSPHYTRTVSETEVMCYLEGCEHVHIFGSKSRRGGTQINLMASGNGNVHFPLNIVHKTSECTCVRDISHVSRLDLQIMALETIRNHSKRATGMLCCK